MLVNVHIIININISYIGTVIQNKQMIKRKYGACIITTG